MVRLLNFPKPDSHSEVWKAFMALASKAVKQERSEPAAPHPHILPNMIISRIDESRSLMEQREEQRDPQLRRTVRHTFGNMLYSTVPLSELKSST
jgi:hypothetical protein